MKNSHLNISVVINRKAGCLGTLASIALAVAVGYFTTTFAGVLSFPLIWMLISHPVTTAYVVDMRTMKAVSSHDDLQDAVHKIDEMRRHEFETGEPLPHLGPQDVLNMMCQNMKTTSNRD